jgi:arsenate reductase
MERTYVKPEAIQVMAEVGVDISDHRSKALSELPDPLNFDLVVTVCDQAAEACPVYPAKTHRLHVSFPDPSGQSLANWRAVRDALRRMSETLVSSLERGLIPSDQELRYATWGTTGLP